MAHQAEQLPLAGLGVGLRRRTLRIGHAEELEHQRRGVSKLGIERQQPVVDLAPRLDLVVLRPDGEERAEHLQDRQKRHVAAVGDRVKGLKPGDRVYAFGFLNPKGGFYAEYAAVKADDVSRIPDELTTQQAGAMPVDAMTALRGLDDTLALKPGESVMIFGASGGIGHLAVQLAKRMGARVFAVASGSDGVALVNRLGADAVVDGHKDDIAAAARQFAPDGLEAALITAGGPAADKALTAMRAGGRVAYPNGVEPRPEAPFGIDAKSYDGMPDPQAIEKLNSLIESSGPPGTRPFEVHVARSFPLAQAAEAHRALDEHYLGKLVLQTA